MMSCRQNSDIHSTLKSRRRGVVYHNLGVEHVDPVEESVVSGSHLDVVVCDDVRQHGPGQEVGVGDPDASECAPETRLPEGDVWGHEEHGHAGHHEDDVAQSKRFPLRDTVQHQVPQRHRQEGRTLRK